MTWNDAITQVRADGWGLRTTAHRAFTPIKDLKIAVEVGLVDGMIAATTPIGSPISVIPVTVSSWMTPTVLIRAMWVATRSEAKRFFAVLSGMLPKPVSRHASSARRAASAIAARDMAATIRSTSA